MKWLVAGGIVTLGYAVVLIVAFLLQGRLIYPGRGSAVVPIERLPSYRGVVLHTSDGLDLRAAFRPGARDAPMIVFFHGNGDDLAGAALATQVFAARGYGVLLPEYRGYGGNPGVPHEAGLYADGRAALRFLAGVGVPADRVILIGNSIGSGVAVQLATETRVAGLIVVSGFTSLPEIAAMHVRWLPVRRLMRDRFDNVAKIAAVRAPVLILHGAADDLIPAAAGRVLAAAHPDATLIEFPRVGHDLAYGMVAQEAARRWLERQGIDARR